MLISTTRFKLKNWLLYGQFFVLTYQVVRQIRRSGGVAHFSLNPFNLRTITAWHDPADMLKFRNSGAHLKAMQASAKFGDITSVTWQANSVPSWAEAKQKLAAADSDS